MTDDTSDLEPIDLGRGPYGAGPAAPGWAPGWYADPWTAGQYRYWNGDTWTGETNRWGPSTANTGGAGDATSPWPAASPVAGGYGWPDPPAAAPAPAVGFRSRHRGPIVAAVVALLVVLVASAAVGYAINANSHSDDSAVQVVPPTTSPGTDTPSTVGPTSPPGRVTTPDPDQSALNALGVQQADINPVRTVLLIPDGTALSEPTLDLCNGNYPSEAFRTARVQVADVDSKGSTSLSTEAVLYRDTAAASQALGELRTVTRDCPHRPVASDVGDDTATTEFHPAPDATWSTTPGVDRQAYSLTTTPADGKPASSIAVYLRRGRALLGLYFPKPTGTQPQVGGQRSIEGIVGVFEARLAKLPASVANK